MENKHTNYDANRKKNLIFLLALFLILLFSSLASLKFGTAKFSLSDFFLGLLGKASDDKINLIMINNRLPRILTSIVAGAGLGLTGAILQVILQNNLASASTIGVSQGASFGAALAIVVFNLSGAFQIPLLSFLGSIIVASFILALSKFNNIKAQGIVLAGVAISAMLAGATTLIQYFADEVQLASLVYWTFGDLGSTGYKDILLIFIVVVLISIYAIFHRWDYNALLAGDNTATSLGLNVDRLVIENTVLCCLAASTIVSNIGLVNFIGLIAPHIVKIFVGNNYIYVIPGSILGGSIILVLSDLVSRMALSPVILPIGAITSFLGGPIFLYLLLKERR